MFLPVTLIFENEGRTATREFRLPVGITPVYIDLPDRSGNYHRFCAAVIVNDDETVEVEVDVFDVGTTFEDVISCGFEEVLQELGPCSHEEEFILVGVGPLGEENDLVPVIPDDDRLDIVRDGQDPSEGGENGGPEKA